MPERIAEYEISGEIGQGGFGRVYKAYDPKVGREVAIKTLNDARDTELINRFRVEATAAGNLNHANIVTIYEFGEWQGVHYLVMEYLAGRDLRHVIKEQANISVLEAMTIMNQVAQGLSFAHNHGVVHRDVKPANIMLLSDGVVKIMDFGIARLTSETQPHLTKSGFILGTLLYLAPEQFAGRPYDALCDIWAFGVVYYELLTGENPFKAAEDASSMYRITAVDPTPLRTIRPDCPPELEQLISRMLTKNREDRYQSLEDVVFDSEPILQRLRKDRAGDLQKVVEGLISEEQFEQAQMTVRQMLELDPFNEDARRWRDKIRKLVRDKEVKPRVQSLIASAESEVQKRRFDEATQFLETALRLDPGNTTVQRTLERVRRVQERHNRVQALLAQAVEELSAQNMTNALFRASEAAAADPESEAAKMLIRQIQEETDLRDRHRKLEAGLASAGDLLHDGSYEQAVILLEDLRTTFPDEPEIVEKIAEVTRRQTRERLNEKLSQGISSARDLLQGGRFAEALGALESLRVEFPDDPTLRELLSFAIKQNDARKQVLEAEGIGRQAWALAKTFEFDPALLLVDEGLRRFPGDAILVRVRVAIRAAQVKHQEETEVKTTLELSRGLAEHKQFDEAIAALQGTLRRFPARVELQQVLDQLQEQSARARREKEEEERAQREQEKLAKVRTELESGRIAEAEALVLELQKELPADAGIAELLNEIRERAAAEVRKEADKRFAESARALIRDKQFKQAIEVLDEGLRTFPGDSDLERLKKTAEGLAASYQRQQAILESDAEGNLLRQAGKYDEALRVVDGALAIFGSEMGLEQCRRNILFEREQAENAKALDKLKADFAALLSSDRPKEAVALIENARSRHTNEPELPRMLELARKAAAAWEDREGQRERRAALAAFELRIRESLSRDDFDRAVAELANTRADYGKETAWQGLWREIEHRVLASPERLPASIAQLEVSARKPGAKPELDQILKTAQAALAAREEEALRIALNRIDQLKRIGDVKRALDEAEALFRLHPSEARIRTVAETLRSELREQTIGRGRQEAATYLQNGNPEQAIEILRKLLREFHGHAGIQQDLDQAARELELSNLLAQARQLLAEGNPVGAIGLLEGAPKPFQDQPEVKRLIASAEEAASALEERKAAWETARLEQLHRAGVFEATNVPEFLEPEPVAPEAAPQPPFWLRYKSALIGAGAVAVVGAGVIMMSRTPTPRAPVAPANSTQPSAPASNAAAVPHTGADRPPSREKDKNIAKDKKEKAVTPAPEGRKPSEPAASAPVGAPTQPVPAPATPATPKEEPKQVVTQPPVTTPVEPPKQETAAKTTPDPVTPAATPSVGRFHPLSGRCTWLGNLAPDGVLVLGDGKVIEGPGSLRGTKWPTDGSAVQISLQAEGTKLEGLPTKDSNFRLTLRNTSGRVLNSIEFTWKSTQ